MILILIIYICIFQLYNYHIQLISSYYFGSRTIEAKYCHLSPYIVSRNHKQITFITQNICPYHQQSDEMYYSQKYFHEYIQHTWFTRFASQVATLLALGTREIKPTVHVRWHNQPSLTKVKTTYSENETANFLLRGGGSIIEI